MKDLNKFILDIVNKAEIAIPKGNEDIIIAQIMPSLVAHLNLNLAQLVSKEDQDIMKGMMLVSPETFNGFEFFKDKIKDFDSVIEELLKKFKEEFLQNN